MNKILLTTLVGLLLFTGPANASLVFNLGGCDFSSDGSSGSCGGSGADLEDNVLSLTFEQNGADSVRLTIDSGQMDSGLGKVTNVWFNVKNGLTFGDLTFNYVSGVEAKKIRAGGNIASGGIFDISFDYKSAKELGQFYHPKTSVYDITASGLLESSFDDLSSKGLAAAMHMNITGSDDGGHYSASMPAVPLPPSGMMLVSGLAGLIALRSRKKE